VVAVWVAAILFFLACTWTSYAHWANFEYRSFDLAFYVQGLWQLLRGRLAVSMLGVPLLGNHVEPIVFLITPLFAVLPHPLTLIVIQNAGLAAMGILGFKIARRLGLKPTPAALLALAVLATPATGYVALHEFHPEALAGPCLMLILYARVRKSLAGHWIGVIALLACKENMALVVAAYCAVHLVMERRRPKVELRSWYVCPLALAAVWFLVCAKFITPALNADAIDYLGLYDRLGSSPADIALKAIAKPQRIFAALGHALRNGNLVWALLLPFLALPLFKPGWLLIATPILLQHLLSWRSSEWNIYYHYAAPLIPLFWIALVATVSRMERSPGLWPSVRTAVPLLVVAGCVAAQIQLGPARSILSSVTQWPGGQSERARKTAFLGQIPANASVVAPLPYLSHLATREKIYSLHFILKGLKTLSRTAYELPAPTEYVLIDYNDSATFDPVAGYYHPQMRMADGRVVPSSDRMLHDFLGQRSWAVNSSNELTLLLQTPAAPAVPAPSPASQNSVRIDPSSTLAGIAISSPVLSTQGLVIKMNWRFQDPREFFPAMFLRLAQRGRRESFTISHGLCAPEKPGGSHEELWRVTPTPSLPAGSYDAELVFLDSAKTLWAGNSSAGSDQPTSLRVPLGEIKVMPSGPAN
jgi:uncharacterized membrane protein